MLATLTFASTLFLAPAPLCVAPGLPLTPDDDLRAMYEAGQTFADFMDSAVRRKELWDENWAKSEGIDMALVERARAVGGTWRFLAVAVDSCSDSVNTIPYLARFTALVPGMSVRVVNSEVGRKVMEDHPTPDGRASTPTVVLLDADWNEAGCFIERPPVLRDWIMENPLELDREPLFEAKMEWYSDDAGQGTLAEIVRMLEAATTGEAVCGK
jgi:hypothetical protein